MNPETLEKILTGIQAGRLSVAAAMERLKTLPFEDLDFAKVDHHRLLRSGHGEVVYCAGKTKEQVRDIVRAMDMHKVNVMGTRAIKEMAGYLSREFPALHYNEAARIFTIENVPEAAAEGTILIVTGGTSDIPVAEEAKATAVFFGNTVEAIYDVGVAGIHRLFSVLDKLRAASVIIVIAGMEGALASVVAGLVDVPVIAVPTSVGYGAAFEGVSALLSMINSCAPGVSVVNIDNGFGAGVIAARINAMSEKMK